MYAYEGTKVILLLFNNYMNNKYGFKYHIINSMKLTITTKVRIIDLIVFTVIFARFLIKTTRRTTETCFLIRTDEAAVA